MSEGHDLVRPYIMTGGRTRAQRRDLRIETLLQTRTDHIPPALPEEQQLVLEQCTRAVSVAEVAAHLRLVVGVVMILADDLIAAGLLEVHHTDPVEIELSMLTKMIERVRAI
jgi:sulfur transfer complex TusBCD TusB component (DsrH family)